MTCAGACANCQVHDDVRVEPAGCIGDVVPLVDSVLEPLITPLGLPSTVGNVDSQA